MPKKGFPDVDTTEEDVDEMTWQLAKSNYTKEEIVLKMGRRTVKLFLGRWIWFFCIINRYYRQKDLEDSLGVSIELELILGVMRYKLMK